MASSAPVSAQQAAQVVVALAASAAVQVEFQRQRVGHRGSRGLHRRFGQQRAAQVGMQHGAGQVQYRTQRRARGGSQILLQQCRQCGGQGAAVFSGADGVTHALQSYTQRRDYRVVSMLLHQRLPRRRDEHLIDAGQVAEAGHQYPTMKGLKLPRVKSVSRISMSRPRLPTSSATGSRLAFLTW